MYVKESLKEVPLGPRRGVWFQQIINAGTCGKLRVEDRLFGVFLLKEQTVVEPFSTHPFTYETATFDQSE